MLLIPTDIRTRWRRLVESGCSSHPALLVVTFAARRPWRPGVVYPEMARGGGLSVFQSGIVPAVIVTPPDGAKRNTGGSDHSFLREACR